MTACYIRTGRPLGMRRMQREIRRIRPRETSGWTWSMFGHFQIRPGPGTRRNGICSTDLAERNSNRPDRRSTRPFRDHCPLLRLAPLLGPGRKECEAPDHPMPEICRGSSESLRKLNNRRCSLVDMSVRALPRGSGPRTTMKHRLKLGT